MFQLYKKRNFSSLLNDTFAFFKVEGKNYFKNYFTINGSIILLLIVILYFFSQLFIDGAFASLQSGNENAFLENLYSNMAMFVGFGTFLLLIIILLSILNYSFPIAYLYLVSQNKDRNFENLWLYFKSKMGRIVLFYCISIVVMIPIIGITILITVLSIFLIIGIPLLFLIFPLLTSFVSLTYCHFVLENGSYFDAIRKSITMLKNNFWNYIGSTFIMMFIVQTVVGIVTLIPYFIGIINLFSNPNAIEKNEQELLSGIYILVLLLFIIAIVVNYTLQNFILVNQGIIYFSGKEAEENTTTRNNIDLIGKNDD